MGDVDAASFAPADGDDVRDRPLKPDKGSANHAKDLEAASFVFARCQQLGIPLVLLTRKTAGAAQLPAFVFDEVGTTGHAVAEQVRDAKTQFDREFFRSVIAPEGSPERGTLPPDRDREWFSNTLCGGESSWRQARHDQELYRRSARCSLTARGCARVP